MRESQQLTRSMILLTETHDNIKVNVFINNGVHYISYTVSVNQDL